jgi:hypothetical protein
MSTAVVEDGVLSALLGQTRMERGIERPVIREWALMAIRNACQCSKAAQEFVLALQPKGTANPEAMKAMGVRTAISEDGKVRLEVDPEAQARARQAAGAVRQTRQWGAHTQAPAAASSSAAPSAFDASLERVIDSGEIEL